MSKTLKEYLNNLEEKRLDKLYNEIPQKLKSPKSKLKKQEKISAILDEIMSNFVVHTLIFTPEANQQLNDLIKGIQPKKISATLVLNHFILKENDNFFIPREIKDLYLTYQNSELQKEKHLIVLCFYMEANGVLTIDKLTELINASGIKLSKKQVLDYVKEKKYIINDNLIYINELAEHLGKDCNLYELKSRYEYKEFTIEEMLMVQLSLAEANYQKQLEKILSKHIKNKQKLSQYATAIFNMVNVGFNYQERITQLLELEGIEITIDEATDIDIITDEIYQNYPIWELNGYCLKEVKKPIYVYEENEDDDFELTLDDYSIEEQIEIYLTAYLAINGAIAIDVFLKILKEEHGINLKKSTLKKIIQTKDFLTLNKDYIYAIGLAENEVERLFEDKNRFNKYKIISNPEKTLYEINVLDEKIQAICHNYQIPKKIIAIIEQLASYAIMDEELLTSLFKQMKFVITPNKLKRFYKELEPTLNKIRLWIYNGYNLEEINELKKEKI